MGGLPPETGASFRKILRANLKLKAKKCFLFRQEVEYLGHEVSGDGVRPLRGKVAALQHLATPANVDERRPTKPPHAQRYAFYMGRATA